MMASPGPARSPRRRTLTLALQLAGFIAGLGLLWWCGAQALRPENREQLSKIAEADWRLAAALLGLSAMSIGLNGMAFWAAIRPVHRLRLLDVESVNVIALVLSLAPFKLSAIFRVLMHRARDHVPLLTIGAWFAALVLIMGVVFGPPVLATVWRGEVDRTWWIVTIAGVGLFGGALWSAARMAAHPTGRTIVQRLMLMVLSLGGSRLRAAAERSLLPRVDDGVRMLADPRWLAAGV
ncbi:MAG: hypothetical protein H7Y88_07945, partial [Phycisphaerales bacterium]|nr:hypothetical protein [Phycisphaerales bacterium]